MPAEGRIEGTVVEKGTGNPLAGVEICAVGSLISGIHQESAKTDEGGHFSMAGMTAGEYRIEIVGKMTIRRSAVIGADGVARLYLLPGKYLIPEMRMTGYAYKSEMDSTFSVETGKTERATVFVAALPPIVLVVSDPTGKPVPGAMGRIMPFVQPSRDVVADPNGRLVLDFADVGPWLCVVLVRHPRQDLAAVVIVAKDEKPPVVVLRPPTKFSGTVKDASGRPVADASVQAQIDASHMGRFAVVAKTRSGKDGRYQLEVANFMAQYAVSAHAPGFSVAEVVLNHPDIAAGKERDLVLKAADRKLRGVVIDTRGTPVPGAIVTARAAATKVYPRSAATDSSGRFALEGLDDEPTIYIYAHVPGRGRSGSGTMKPGDQELTITAAPSEGE